MKEHEKINILRIFAIKARERAYAPVTGIRFGAALMTKSGKIHLGGNNEDWSLTLTRHAEMCAIDRMLYMRENEDDQIIDIIVVVGDPTSLGLSEPIFPCGLCRSYMANFSTEHTIVIALDTEGHSKMKLFNNLLSDRPFKKMKEKLK